MKYQRAVLPPRTDLRSRRKRVAARVMVRGLDLYERLKWRLLVEVPSPADDPFYRVPENLEAFHPGEVLDARPVEVRRFRRLINADAWQVKFRSTDSDGAAVSGVTTVMIPRRPFDGSVRLSSADTPSASPALRTIGCMIEPLYCTQSNQGVFQIRG